MHFENFNHAWNLFLLIGFLLAVVIGAVINKTNFCTMGAVSDWVNIGDKRRFRAWMLAIAVALIAVAILEPLDLIKADAAFPPYRSPNFVWIENLLGGLLFGIGMTLASGCGNRTLIRFGAGNAKSLVVLFIIAVIAYFMLNPFPGTDQTLYSSLFLPWTQHLSIDLGQAQDLGTLLTQGAGVQSARALIGAGLGAALLVYVFSAKDFRKDGDNILSGSVTGLAVVAAWVATSVITMSADGEIYALRDYYNEWDFLAADDFLKPSMGAPLSPQSYTFINPLGQTLGYLGNGPSRAGLSFGIVAVFGVILGSFLWAIWTKGFRFEWFAHTNDFLTHVIGAVLMGFGGVLGLGCTIGQGITGVSTLAIGSLLTTASIIFGSALTMKVQYYRMVYEDEASFGKALIASLVDLRLLPKVLRQLEKV